MVQHSTDGTDSPGLQPTTTAARTKRPGKFPLTLHRTGQYCKKIKGRICYFGKDKQEALRRYHQQATALHSGERHPALTGTALTLRSLCNLYLEYQHSEVAAGEIKQRYYYDQCLHLKALAQFIGPDTAVGGIKTIQIQNFRKKLLDGRKAAATVNNHLAAIKAMFNWASDNEIIDQGPNLKAVKKVTQKKVERQTFTPDQIGKLLSLANPSMRAMILLGLNCGFGCTDCSELRWNHLDLEKGRVDFPRGKTGVQRNFLLWPETLAAIKILPVRGELVFYTDQGNPWVRPIAQGKSHDDALSKEFTKLLRRAKIATQKGTGFYTLRRTAATIAAETGDVFAVKGVLGHADLKMASTYVQNISQQTDRAIQHTHQRLHTAVTDPGGSE